jgi:phosphotransferase family enzyme
MPGPAVLRLPDPARIADPEALGRVLGPVAGVEASRLETPGFSGSTHTRLAVRLADGAVRHLVLKHTRVADDWLSARTDDLVGREGLLVGEPTLSDVWRAFACPYLAWAGADGEVSLLMDDLTPHLLPDVREPIAEAAEERLLGAGAAMYAAFWESPALDLPWLARPGQLLGLLNAATLAGLADRGFPHPVVERAHTGWTAAFAHLPDRVAALLREPPEALAERGAHLPRTLTHGDFKVANFALMPDGRVAAFDWAVVGAGPVAMELGWHLAVNATRIPDTKERSIARYRRALEAALGRPLGEGFWTETVANAVLAGGAMMLWSKALALESGTARARAEWDWWVDRLAAL